MKKSKIYFLLIIVATFWSCEPKTDEVPSIGNPPSTPVISYNADPDSANLVHFKVTSDNAFSYYWDFGNNTTGSGSDITAFYSANSDYTVTVIAAGKGGQNSSSVTVKVKGIPEMVVTSFMKLLAGYDENTQSNDRTWVWDKSFGTYSQGAAESPSTYFDPIETSWWESDADLFVDAGCYDDEYSFEITPTGLVYNNNCGPTFYYNWAWANELRGTSQGEYEDIALPYSPPASSWSVEEIVSGVDTARVIHLTNDAYLGLAEGTHDYQVMLLNADTLWVRFDATGPGGEMGENKDGWDYLRFLAKK